jgi:ABC-type sugar transport system permease subunit
MSQKTRAYLSALLYVLPAIAVYTLIVVYPTVQGFAVSLTEWGVFAEPRFVGLANYVRLFTRDAVFYGTVRNTAIYVLVVVSVPIIVGVVLAVLIDGLSRRRFADFLRGLFFMPTVLSGIAVGLIWGWFYNPHVGLLNALIALVTGKQFIYGWLGEPRTALASVMVVKVWMSVGFCMVVFLAGLRGIPEEYNEAALIDGASTRQRFFRITLPLLRPAFAILLLLDTIDAFKEFTLIFIMTQGGPYRTTELITTYMYDRAFVSWDLGYASSMGVVLFLIILVVSIALRKVVENLETGIGL